MKIDKTIIVAVGTALIAAAIVLSLRLGLGLDRLAGVATILALIGIVALEYRVNWKKLFSR